MIFKVVGLPMLTKQITFPFNVLVFKASCAEAEPFLGRLARTCPRSLLKAKTPSQNDTVLEF